MSNILEFMRFANKYKQEYNDLKKQGFVILHFDDDTGEEFLDISPKATAELKFNKDSMSFYVSFNGNPRFYVVKYKHIIGMYIE